MDLEMQMKPGTMAILASALLVCAPLSVPGEQRNYDNVKIPETYVSAEVAGVPLVIGAPLDIDSLIAALDFQQIPYGVKDDYEYPFWGTGGDSSAVLITTKEYEIVWIK
jgi:hypothetical protein